MGRRERWAWVALLALALLLRLWALGDRPPHHDEAVHAHFAHELLHQGTYRYDPPPAAPPPGDAPCRGMAFCATPRSAPAGWAAPTSTSSAPI